MKIIIHILALIACVAISPRMGWAQDHPSDDSLNHTHHARFRLAAEMDIDLDTMSLDNAEALGFQGWVQVAGSLWLGGGISGIGSLFGEHPGHGGALVDISAMLELRRFETQLRFFLEHVWHSSNEVTLLRLDWRSIALTRISPMVRLVVDHVPNGWDQNEPGTSRWEIVPFLGVVARLGGNAAHPHFSVGVLLGWRAPRHADEPWTDFVPTIFAEWNIFQ